MFKKLWHWITIASKLCVEWFDVISGGVSVPFAALALYYNGHERDFFALVAFSALFVCAFGGIIKNHKLKIESQSTLIELKKAHDAEIQILKDKLNEKCEADKLVESKLAAKGSLGHGLLALHDRFYVARELSFFKFENEFKENEWEITKGIFKQIELDMIKYLTHSEFSLFRIATPPPVAENHLDDVYTRERRKDWIWHYTYIEAKINALKSIIEKL